jgi:hypothetical protein
MHRSYIQSIFLELKNILLANINSFQIYCLIRKLVVKFHLTFYDHNKIHRVIYTQHSQEFIMECGGASRMGTNFCYGSSVTFMSPLKVSPIIHFI